MSLLALCVGFHVKVLCSFKYVRVHFFVSCIYKHISQRWAACGMYSVFCKIKWKVEACASFRCTMHFLVIFSQLSFFF